MLDVHNATPQDIWSARLLLKMNDQDGIETPDDIAAIARLPLPDIGTPEHPGPDSPRIRRGYRLKRGRKLSSAFIRSGSKVTNDTSVRVVTGPDLKFADNAVSVSHDLTDEEAARAAELALATVALQWVQQEVGTVRGPLTVAEVQLLVAELSGDLALREEDLAAQLVADLPQSVLERALELLKQKAESGQADVIEDNDAPQFADAPSAPEGSKQH